MLDHLLALLPSGTLKIDLVQSEMATLLHQAHPAPSFHRLHSEFDKLSYLENDFKISTFENFRKRTEQT